VAAKGIIKKGVVTAYEVGKTAPIGTAITADGSDPAKPAGTYSLSVNASYGGGPVKLELTGDAATTMVCDVSAGCGTTGAGSPIPFGTDFALPAGFKLTSYLPSVASGATVNAQITPFTDMAAKRIETLGGTNAPTSAQVTEATAGVNALLGVNIHAVQPIDITKVASIGNASPEQLQYAAFNAGAGSIIFNSASGVAAVSSMLSGGSISANDITAIKNAVQAEAANPALSDPSLIGNTTVSTFNTQLAATLGGMNGTYTPPAPPDTTTQSTITQARNLVQQTRTWVTDIKALKSPADAFKLDVQTAEAVLNSGTASLSGAYFDSLNSALSTIDAQLVTSSGVAANTAYPFEVTGTGCTFNPNPPYGCIPSVLGSGTVTASNNAGTLKLSFAATVSGATVNGTVTTNIPASVLGTTTTSLNLAGLDIAVSGSATRTTPSAASFTLNNAALKITLKAGAPPMNTSQPINQTHVANYDFSGGITMQANGVTFSGTGSIALIANNVTNAKSALSLKEIALNGTFSNSAGNSAKASATLTFNNAATFDVIGLLQYQPVVWAWQSQLGDPFGFATWYANQGGSGTFNYGSYNWWSNQTCGNNTSWLQEICVPGDALGIAAAIQAKYPGASSVQNVYADYSSGTTWYGATVTYPDFETASNFAKATLTVSGEVTLAGHPKATLTVAANRTDFGNATRKVVGNVSAVLSWNGQILTFNVNNTVTTPASAAGELTITNPAGVKLVLNGTSGATTGKIFVNTTEVGTIDTGTNGVLLVHYKDGTFESLQ
jgi:hypothetical protein